MANEEKNKQGEKNRSFFKSSTYEDFRKFLKINFYYCSLSQEQQAEFLKIKGTTRYNEYKNIVEKIADGKITFPKYNKKKAFKYDVTQFESDYNILADSFQLKTITALNTCLTISIMMLLSNKPLTAKQIIDEIDIGDIDVKTIKETIRSMAESGLITKKDKKYYFEECKFYSVDIDILLKLVNMADFMKNLIYPEVSGYRMFELLKKVYEKRTDKKYDSPFQFKYSHLANILDDDVLWTLLEAIEKHQTVSFEYADKKKENIIPVKLYTENEHNRRYLFAVKNIRKKYKILIFRLSEIYNLKIMEKETPVSEELFDSFLGLYSKEKEYSFLGKMDSSDEKATIEIRYKKGFRKQIERDFNCVEFGKNNTATVTVKNKKMIKPYLRANIGLVETTDEELSGLINSEIEEMKKIYGIIQ